MRKRKLEGKERVGRHFLADTLRGFFGEQNQGKLMLHKMGLPTNQAPFSIGILLMKGRVIWRDIWGNIATISYRMKPDQVECFGDYLGKRRSLRMFLEWGRTEDPERVARLESEAIGDLCMRCVYETMSN